MTGKKHEVFEIEIKCTVTEEIKCNILPCFTTSY